MDNNGTATIYIDGQADATGFNYTRGTLTLNRTGIGAILRGSPSSYFTGRIDEVSIWNVARSETDIRNTMHKVLNGDESNLVVYYRFDHISGTALSDRTTNDNDGTLHNMDDSDWIESGAIWKRWESGGTDIWGTATNWSTTFSVPTLNDMVLIPTGTTSLHITNDPASPARCKILKVEDSSTLIIDNGKALTIGD